jgi:Tfp pilus assembly protein PilF
MAKKLPPEVQAILSASDAGLFATAADLLQQFLQANPDSVRGWIDLGHAMTQVCRFEAAEKAYQTAIGLAGADGPVEAIYGEMGHLCRTQGNFEAAQQWYRKQIDQAPDDAIGYLFLGNLQLSSGNRPQAIETLQRGVECQNSAEESIHLALAHAYVSGEQYFEARQQLEKCLQFDPNLEPARRLLKDVKNLANR